VAAVAWLFGGPLFAGRVLYYRDVGVTYYPDFVFVSRALVQAMSRSHRSSTARRRVTGRMLACAPTMTNRAC